MAQFAQLNVMDKDGDVTLPGNFESGAQVAVSAYNHMSWKGALPVGRGTISEDGDYAVADMQFFIDTTQGLDTFNTVKGMKELQEWSYGFDPIDSGPGVFDGAQVNLLRKSVVYEVSPVLRGAGIGTATRSVKGLSEVLSVDYTTAVKDWTEDDWKKCIALAIERIKGESIIHPELVEFYKQVETDAALKLWLTEQAPIIAACHGIELTNEGN